MTIHGLSQKWQPRTNKATRHRGPGQPRNQFKKDPDLKQAKDSDQVILSVFLSYDFRQYDIAIFGEFNIQQCVPGFKRPQ